MWVVAPAHLPHARRLQNLGCVRILPCRAVPCRALPCPVLSCPVLSYPVLSRPVLSRPVLPGLVPNCQVLSECCDQMFTGLASEIPPTLDGNGGAAAVLSSRQIFTALIVRFRNVETVTHLSIRTVQRSWLRQDTLRTVVDARTW